MSTRDIQAHVRELYGIEVSPDLVSAVTDSVIDEVAAWPAWIAMEEIDRGLLVALSMGKQAPVRQWVVSHRRNRSLSFSESLFMGITRLVGWNQMQRA